MLLESHKTEARVIETQWTAIKAVYELTNSPIMIRDASTKRLVSIDPLRAVRESLDQLYVKEYESSWINDTERYNDLVKVPPPEVAKETNEGVKLEKAAS